MIESSGVDLNDDESAGVLFLIHVCMTGSVFTSDEQRSDVEKFMKSAG